MKIKMKNNLNISIIIICDQLRREKLLRLFLSLQSQLSLYDTEILLLHESNTPLEKPDFPEVPIVQTLLRYINIPEKQGIPFNRNKGIEFAQGNIIIFIDDDCWVQEKWLPALVDPLLNDKTDKTDKKIMAVTGGTVIPSSNFFGDCVSALGFPGGGSLGFAKVWKVSPEGMTTHLSVGNCAIRREVFQKVGLFDESMKSGAEDTEFSYRLEQAGIFIKYVPDSFAYHEARTSWNSFIHWQLRRGKANYQFKKKVGNIQPFVKLRFWSAKNILRENAFNRKFPLVFGLLGASVVLQQMGYFQEKWTERTNRSK
ncbi:glycosyltransferase [Candidatus Woesearchaeota archaeon]|nr:glycosyltransferase [Candidatus Woesearchaeota archaeon]